MCGRHPQVVGDLQLLFADTSTAVIQHSAAYETFSHAHSLPVLKFSVFTVLGYVPCHPNALKRCQYFPCVSTLPSEESHGVADRSMVRIEVPLWQSLHNSHPEL